MSETNQYGQIISRTAVEKAVVASLDIWLDDALGELERVDGYDPGSIQRPLGIVTRSQFEKWPEDQIPVVMVINTGLAKPPVPRAQGVYDAAWLVGVVPIVSDIGEDGTRDLAGTYGAAIRMALSQHSMLKSSAYPNGFAQYANWVGEDYTDMPFLATRSLDSARIIFEVGVDSVVTKQAGPRVAPTDPSADPGPWPAVADFETRPEPVLIGDALP